MAGIQAARMGASTLIVEETPWLGGMLTSAGVSAIDGNYKLYSGLWDEFRNRLYDYYGGPDSVKTGWVSNVLFEPQVGAKLLWEMAQTESKLEVLFESHLEDISKTPEGWEATVRQSNDFLNVTAKIIIDGTELGDIAKMVGVPYDIGMESRFDTGEEIAPESANDIIQDLTYVAILKDYGEGANMTIERPDNYDPTPFLCNCAGKCDEDSVGRKLWGCDLMMEYGRLPNGKYMINWPIFGNDYYVNAVELEPDDRESSYRQAKEFTLNYVYYLQTELGYSHLGIADDVFPTADGLPFFPYHRESRRIKGLVRFDVNDLARPFDQDEALYRTGIAVGDYPVDHHHHAYPSPDSLPDLHFYPVPSYSLPLGVLIPKDVDHFIVAEKSISVTNLVNGTTRLQPVCLLIGQAAGTLAALSARENLSPREVSVRAVQAELINSGAYLLPYLDVVPQMKSWKAIQKVGATGILKGEGRNVGWENQTLFYPDSVVTVDELRDGLKDFPSELDPTFNGEIVTVVEAISIAELLATNCKPKTENKSHQELMKLAESIWNSHDLGTFEPEKPISRAAFCVLLDEIADPFGCQEVDHQGRFIYSE